jgi:hypothetical protein
MIGKSILACQAPVNDRNRAFWLRIALNQLLFDASPNGALTVNAFTRLTPDRLDCQRNVITPAPVGLNPQASM